jgi:methylenetetrahydrofolate reductase (NADPH)
MSMLVGQPRREPPTLALKQRIVSFMQRASTEISPSEEKRLPELASILRSGTPVYVAHTPNAGFAQVIHAALAVRDAGFLATPHIAVRKIPDVRTLRAALGSLQTAGVEQILLIAGDAPRPLGEFSSTQDVLRTRLLEDSGITRIGVAGHPEGHNTVANSLLWEALETKQAFARRAGVSMHIVTQFGLNAGAFGSWEHELVRRRIELPVRVGIAGPAPLSRLMHFAIRCGIGASMRALMRNLNAAAHASHLALSPDQHLLALLAAPLSAQIVAPHFFAFGGALQTARWIQRIAAGGFEIDPAANRFSIQN